MRPLIHPPAEAITLPGLLHALADPVRLAIVRRLAEVGEASCRGSCNTLPAATLSNHVRILREAGVIRSRREGTELINMLRRGEIDGRFPGLLDAILRASADVAA
ncbi:MAG: metalloregulator ArsR/SmtB family transcription factor [Thalassobaculales bacterium]